MMLDIQGGFSPTPPTVPQARSAPAASMPGASVPAPAAAPARPKVIEIVRPDIKVDTEGDTKRLQVAVERMNAKMADGGRGLNFSVDPALNRPVVTVTNKETGEVIRQIPNEAVIRMAHSIEDTKGLLLNAKV
jgi:flagellar protein FlaG